MLIDIDFTGRHVAVFGGTSGINLGVAEGFARRGARLSVVSRSATKVAAACRQLGGNAHGACADVRDMAAVQAACAGAAARFGPIDVLVSGAAGNFPASASALSSNGFQAVVDIDLLGTFHVVRAAYPHLRKPGASVINISAPQAAIPMRYQAHVCAAKAGVDQLTRVLALEWGAVGVRVNAISPGPIRGTEGVRKLIGDTDQALAQIAARVPLARLGEAEDIANLALFLASPYAGYLSGAVIACDGGGAIDGIKDLLEAAAGRAAAPPPG